jgi:hypothetical protein
MGLFRPVAGQLCYKQKQNFLLPLSAKEEAKARFLLQQQKENKGDENRCRHYLHDWTA